MKIEFSIAVLLLSGIALISGCSDSSNEASFGDMVSDEKAVDNIRKVVPLGKGWKFYFGEIDSQVIAPDFDDGSWESIEVPHSWNRVGYYNNDWVDQIHGPENIDKRQGIGWYRLAFSAPLRSDRERFWLEFDAASRTAEVWLNGKRLGEHRSGFARFRFDATDVVLPGKNNVLVVKVDNSQPSAESSTADTLPIAGDFFVHGGLYRPVRLVMTNPVHFDMRDFGGPGVYATTPRIDQDRAEVHVRSRMRNDGNQHQEISLNVSLIDSQGAVVAKAQQPFALDSMQDIESSQVLHVDGPVLWQGMENPYLYTLRVELWADDSRLLDRIDQQYGIRQMAIDPELGFILNGKPYRLRGVAYHQDREGKGWAVGVEDIEEDVELMVEMGANTIRLAHYPHGQPIHEMANRLGLVLWDEIPLVTSWAFGKEHPEVNESLAENAKLQLKEMIRQNFNHPSVAVWGVANEVDFGVVLPGFLGAPASDLIDPMPLLKELDSLSRKEDQSRPTTLASCCEGRTDMGDADIPVTAVAAEVSGVNLYFGWYVGAAGDLGPHLDKIRGIRPEQPLSVSEYGAGGAISVHTDNPLGGPIDPRGQAQPEQYETYVHEESWSILASKPYLWGSWVWNSFDFATTVRHEGDSIDINTKGLITYDRKIKKDAYHFYKANWSEAPTVHITSRRYLERAYANTEVRVYSNARETELAVNGRSLGKKTECPMKICIWPEVRLSAGSNVVTAQGRYPSGAEVDRVEWQLDPTLVQSYHIDSGALIASPSTSVKFGSDNFFDGGSAATADQPADWGKPPTLAPISGDADRQLLATFREGDFTYRLPLDNGEYRVRLLFIEPSEASGSRQFDVLVNGQTVLERFDIAAESNDQMLTEVDRTFEVTVTDGSLELEFQSVTGRALVSAVMVDPLAR